MTTSPWLACGFEEGSRTAISISLGLGLLTAVAFLTVRAPEAHIATPTDSQALVVSVVTAPPAARPEETRKAADSLAPSAMPSGEPKKPAAAPVVERAAVPEVRPQAPRVPINDGVTPATPHPSTQSPEPQPTLEAPALPDGPAAQTGVPPLPADDEIAARSQTQADSADDPFRAAPPPGVARFRVLLDDQHFIRDVVIEHPSGDSLGDLTYALALRNLRVPVRLEPPLAPGESKWIRYEIRVGGQNGRPDEQLVP